MTLAYALAPEGVILAVGENCRCVKAIEREHTWVPAHRYHSDLAAIFCGVIHSVKMRGYFCVSIKAVYDVKERSECGSLLRKVCCRATAEYHNVYHSDEFFHVGYMADRSVLSVYFKCFWVAAGKDCNKLHIAVLANCKLNTTTEISISENSNFNAHDFTSIGNKSILNYIINLKYFQ